MAYFKAPLGRDVREPSKKDLLLAVGGHAFVNAPQSQAQHSAAVPLSDDRGHQVENDLRDGEEVEILAWRPRAREGLAYQVRRVSDGREWWIAALYLRRSCAVPAIA